MTLTADSFKCDYLGSQTPSISHVFANESAELVHLNEKISSLDSHISQLYTLRAALLRRLNQLQSMPLSIYALPAEVLSRIFEQLVVGHCHSARDHLFYGYRTCLSQALVLGSVSAHFRHVALGTPELWKRVSLNIRDTEAIDKISALLQHCMALTTSVDVSVMDSSANEEDSRSAMNTVLNPDTIPRIRAFSLGYTSCYTSSSIMWIKKIKDATFPMLDDLSIDCPSNLIIDIGNHKTITRLSLYNPSASGEGKVIAPPSLKYLTATGLTEEALTSLLYQCPNLVECFAAASYNCYDIRFNEPLTLNNLKRLTLRSISVAMTPSSLLSLRLPSLETLQLTLHHANQFMLLRDVSTTLTTLNLRAFSALEHDAFHLLWRTPFPNLEEMELVSDFKEFIVSATRMLKLLADECRDTEARYLPSLTVLTLRCAHRAGARCLAYLMDIPNIGETAYLCIKFECNNPAFQDEAPKLREELKSSIGSHQIEVVSDGSKLMLLRRADSLLPSDSGD